MLTFERTVLTVEFEWIAEGICEPAGERFEAGM